MIKEALDKRAVDELRQLNIYIKPGGKGGAPKAIVRKFEKPKETVGQVATKTVGRAAMGGAMAGGLPFAFLGVKPSGERTPFRGTPTTIADAIKNEKLLKGLHKRQKLMRGLALGGALAGAGSALYDPIKQKIKGASMIDNPSGVGKFKEKSTQRILGAPGESSERTAVNPDKPIKEVLAKQAWLETQNLGV